MSALAVVMTAIGYLVLLFGIAYWAERRAAAGNSFVNNSLIYALSLGVYCTAWTFYGSVGRAATQSAGFLPIYLGPVISAPLWWLVLRKMILISKTQRITSIADFVSSRYGKSATLGILATLILVIGVVPYISLQLKAIVTSFDILTENTNSHIFGDASLYVAIALAIFTIWFGTRQLDPNERHEGLVAAIAFESIIKLITFLSVGIFVVYGIYHGFKDLFTQALQIPDIAKLLFLNEGSINSWEWFWLALISAFAVLLLPRQFHIAVVENTNPAHVSRASWLFPLYLLLINVFVLPIAIAGLIILKNHSVEPDSFVLSLPMLAGKPILALFVTIGGFSAATSMVIVEVIALSIMISNNLVLPTLLQFSKLQQSQPSHWLLGIRRISIIVVILLSYSYYKGISENYPLVSTGLISFVAVAQFAPSIFIGMYWKRATKAGAMTGLLLGFCTWFYTLPLPALQSTGVISADFITYGFGGISALKPYSLLGLDGLDSISHSAFWSLLFNTFSFIFVSLYTRQNPLEVTQADVFVDIYKYSAGSSEYDVMRRRAKVKDLQQLLIRFLGEERTQSLWQDYEKRQKVDLSKMVIANADLINYADVHLTGVIGAASAKILLSSVTKEDPISLEEMLRVLEQTQEIIQYSQALERKSEELELTTQQLQQANEQLQELDRLKADFVATVTHELRTPITSIKALSKILSDNENLPITQRTDFLTIITNESERITRLINQVLDLERIQAHMGEDSMQSLDFVRIVEKAYAGLKPLMEEKEIQSQLIIKNKPLIVWGNADRLTQVVVNLIGNAIKFCKNTVNVQLSINKEEVLLTVQDNGRGVAQNDQSLIFQKFRQVNDAKDGKPQGSGLGLFISKTIVERHSGSIGVKSQLGEGALFFVKIPIFKI